MIIGRLIAYLLMIFSTATGLGEVFVLLFGDKFMRVDTSDLWIIFVGPVPGAEAELSPVARFLLPLMDWPAWIVCGLFGLVLYGLTRFLTRTRRAHRRTCGYNTRHYG